MELGRKGNWGLSAGEKGEVEGGGERIPVKSNFIASLQIPASDEVLIPFPDQDIALGGGPALEDEMVHGLSVHVPNPNFGAFVGVGGACLLLPQHRQHLSLYDIGRHQQPAQDPQVALRQPLLDLPRLLVQLQRRRHTRTRIRILHPPPYSPRRPPVGLPLLHQVLLR